MEGAQESWAKCRFGKLRIEEKLDVIRYKELAAVEGKSRGADLASRAKPCRVQTPVEMWWHTVTQGRGSEGETGEWSA